MILLISTLFALILSLLTMGTFNQSILVGKESYYFNSKNLALAAAENNLITKQQSLLAGNIPIDAEIIGQDCGIIFYRLRASGNYGDITTAVTSTVAVVGDTSHCHPKPVVVSGVKSWRSD